MDDYHMFIRGFDIAWAITSGLAPRLGINNVNHDPSTLIKTLVAKNGGSCKKFFTQAKTKQQNPSCLKEDFGPHILVCQFLEEIGNTKNYYVAIMHILSKLRSHLRRHGDI